MREKYSTLALPLLLCICLASGCGRAKDVPPPRPREGGPGAPAAGAEAVPMTPAPPQPPGSAPALSEKPRAAAMEPATGTPPPPPPPANMAAPDRQAAPLPQAAPDSPPNAAFPPPPAEARGRPGPALLLPQLANSRAFGLMAPAGPIIPEDLGIGSLQDYRPKDKARLAAMECARGFLDGIVKGEMATARIDPAKAELIGLLAEEALASPRPVAYRLGAIEPGESGASRDTAVKFRLMYEGFGKEGELGLRFSQGSWYVESVSFTGE